MDVDFSVLNSLLLGLGLGTRDVSEGTTVMKKSFEATQIR